MFIEEQARRAFVARVVRYKQIGGISDEYPLRIKGPVRFKNPYYIAVEPGHQPPGVGVPGRLAQVVLIAGRLALILILLVESRTVECHVSRLRVYSLMTHRRAEGIDHTARAHHIRKSEEAVDAVETQGDVPGNIYPQRNIVFLTWRGVCCRQFVQYLLRGDGLEEGGFRHFVGRIDIIKLAPAESLHHQRIMALK